MILAYGRCPTNGEFRILEPFADGGKRAGRDAQVENAVARQSKLAFDVFDARFQCGIGLPIVVSTGEVEQPFGEHTPAVFLQRLTRMRQHAFAQR